MRKPETVVCNPKGCSTACPLCAEEAMRVCSGSGLGCRVTPWSNFLQHVEHIVTLLLLTTKPFFVSPLLCPLVCLLSLPRAPLPIGPAKLKP